MNNALKYCTGDIIKPMMADDFFVDTYALEKIVNCMKLNSDKKWLVSGCVHCDSIHFLYRRMIPSYNHDIHRGKNTISSPSVLVMKQVEFFDENLSMLMDCEMYKRLYVKYSQPVILEDALVCNRVHESQMQHKEAHKLESEIKYCESMYG